MRIAGGPPIPGWVVVVVVVGVVVAVVVVVMAMWTLTVESPG